MDFKEWMRHEGLSESSIKKYSSSIEGPLTDWAIEAGIIRTSILKIQLSAQFNRISTQIMALSIFGKRNVTGHQMYSSALSKYAAYLNYLDETSIERDLEKILADQNTKPTETTNSIKCRLGQGSFRDNLWELWKGCSVTGYNDLSVLVASHIKPWSQSTNAERLDKYNGLLLLPNIDKAFDRGLITFDEHGKILISPYLNVPGALGICNTMAVRLMDEHKKYMRYHNKFVFKK